MRLSEMSTDVALDKICEITPYAMGIAEDKEFMKMFVKKAFIKEDAKPEAIREAAYKMTLDKIKKFVPIVLKKHREDVFGVLSVLNEKSIEEISKQPVTTTIKECIDVFNDKELLDFFTSLI